MANVRPEPCWLNTSARVVALTFDDGPDPGTTPELLALLAEHGIQATFFCVGRRVKEFPDLARRITAAGHRVENHSCKNPQPLDEPVQRPALARGLVARAQEIIRSGLHRSRAGLLPATDGPDQPADVPGRRRTGLAGGRLHRTRPGLARPTCLARRGAAAPATPARRDFFAARRRGAGGRVLATVRLVLEQVATRATLVRAARRSCRLLWGEALN